MSGPLTFVVSGVPREGGTRGATALPAPTIGKVKTSVLVTAQRAARDGDVRLTATPGEDVVVVHIAGGPSLWLHPENARDLLHAQHDPARERGAADSELRPGEVRIPSRLQWRLEDAVPARGVSRGFLGDVLVHGVDVITGLFEDKAADFVASKVVEAFDSRVDAGVYRLTAERLARLQGQSRATIPASDGPSLVLAHGTFSETSGTFGKLWVEHPQLVRSLFATYGDRVYALDHPTLGASPISNAITLADAVAKNARLHLLTHSRGGLVAEVLARVAARPTDSFEPFNGKAHAKQRKELQQLAALVSGKHIRVDRVVRVACPARGTLLASKRLDAYLSVIKWSLELAGVPVVPELLGFLGEVARRRADPESLPGLAAQIPDSPLVQWLHSIDEPIDGDLRVVAGDLEGDSVVSWVKTLLSDAFYWTDNDLVVQTRSMYGGMPRESESTFVLDQGGKVSHFNYFSNSETATAIVNALAEENPAGFRAIGPLSWSGQSSTGVRAALVERSPAAAARLPALFVLPGILGSHLKVGKDRVWLGWRLVNGFGRLAYLAGKDDVEPDGPIGSFYDDVAAYLSTDHDVISFAFDWRRPIEEEARRLAVAVDEALEARKSSGLPVRMLAHSMGGIVARTMQLEKPATWTRMMKIDGARILMLGTPNAGSWAPMQVLSGDDTLGNVVTSVGAPFRANATRQLIAQFPGLLQLQADLLGDLGKESTWKALADADLAAVRRQSSWHRVPSQLEQFRWGIPAQSVLTAAAALRRRLDRQREKDLGTFAGKLLLVVGQSMFTPASHQVGEDGLVYLGGPGQGDGTVTHESALLPGVDTWTVDSEHGELPRRKEAFEAYRELLNTGKTGRLLPFSMPPATRGAATRQALVRSRPSRAISDGVPPQRETEVLAPSGRTGPVASRTNPGAALRISIVNGDLTYVAEPLLIGHYHSSRLTGAEKFMDKAIGDTMSASLLRGLYPVGCGTHQVFLNGQSNPDNPWQLPRPAAVIVAGLGAEGELRGSGLVQTVRQAVLAWGQRLSERAGTPATFTLATTLLGSGGSGVSAGQAAQLIAQGVREANDQLAGEASARQRWPRVEHLRIIELYLDRATEAWRSLQALSATSPALFIVAPTVEQGTGGLRRPIDANYRGANYDFISAVVQKTGDQDEQIVYTVDTKRSRTEVRAQATQVSLIRNMVSTASSNTNADPLIGGTLFRLLVPVDLEPFMGSSVATVIEVDSGTAGIPWEILDSRTPGSGDDRPWAIRTKLLRKLRTGVGSPRVTDASADDCVLVIGDPSCDRAKYPRLYGARREAAAVASRLFAAPPGQRHGRRGEPSVTSLVSAPDPSSPEPDATAVVNAVEQRGWRVIHIAGHGEPPIAPGGRTLPRGVVLSDDSFLGPHEISSLRVIPELVFVNCCYLARGDATQLLKETRYDRSQFASGVAESLIKAGVRCVVAAGWAVDDAAALVFADTFYTRLLEGHSFIDAVGAARVAARECGGNTWAAYQCYGDPDWKYRRGTGDAQRPTEPPPSQEFGGIASSGALVLALETLAVGSEFQGAGSSRQAERLRYLEAAFEPLWRDNGQAAQAFGTAWAKAGNFDDAIVWYERARTAADGGSSLAAIEQLASLKGRRAWKRASQVGAKAAAGRAAARSEILEAIALLDTLGDIGPTLERQAIYGATYKRLALIEAADGRVSEELKAIEKMKDHYSAAEQIARTSQQAAGTANAFYPAMNRIAAELALEGGTRRQPKPDAEDLENVRRSMSAAPADFWSVVGQTELDMYASLRDRSLDRDMDALTAAFRKHFERISAPKMWGSVHDNAVFVLSKYQQRATKQEAKAAQRLLDALAELAGQTPSASSSRGASKPRRRKPGGSKRAASSTPRRPR